MLIKRDLLQFRRFGMGILATCLTSVVTPQQLLATPLKAHSFNTKQNSDVSPATVQLKHAEYLLAEQSIDSETFWKNYSDNTRSDEYNLSSKQVIQAKTKKPVEVKQRSGYSINSNLSTLGFGVEGTKQFTSNFNGRLGVNFAGLQVNQKQTNIKYGADLKFFSISALGDWYP
ncbi:MAG TPA: hypothetical protein DEV81_01695, partial [Cyanobacteria bacterium UBA11049]|nr:hypothetical protein [Cyanobacteria bacterium UBA11049]